MIKGTFDARSALADIMSDKKPKRGRKKGGRNNHKKDYPIEVDPERIMLIQEITEVYNREGYGWVIEENPREKYTTDQLRNHVRRLREGHRAWIMKTDWRKP